MFELDKGRVKMKLDIVALAEGAGASELIVVRNQSRRKIGRVVAKADEKRLEIIRDMVIAEHVNTTRSPGGRVGVHGRRAGVF